MAVPVLLVHSSGPQGPEEGSGPFATRLRELLGPDYEVRFPIMPVPDDPHDDAWSDRLEQLFAEVDDPIVVVGPLDGYGHLLDRGDLSEIGDAIRGLRPG